MRRIIGSALVFGVLLGLLSESEAQGQKDGWRLTGKGGRVYGAVKRSELRSLSSTARCQLTLVNKTKKRFALTWIDFNGQAKNYGQVAPGETKPLSTYVSHVWQLSEKKGQRGAQFFVADAVSAKVEIVSGRATKKRKSVKLPSRVDNSTRKYFPPVIAQKHNSCSQQSAIYYILSYELNYRRNQSGFDPHNQYSPLYSWRYLNSGQDKGSEVVDGWLVAKYMGLPNLVDYDDRGQYKYSGWMSGYPKYHRAMKNRVQSYQFFKVRAAKDLKKAKSWLYNRNDPELSVGTLLAFDARPAGAALVTIPEGHYEAGKTLIKHWGHKGGGHLMTLVGYDDQVAYDLNGDGKISNDQDNNGDGKVTLADWERGAFILVNSWGTRWGDRGFAYLPYRHFAITSFERSPWLARINATAQKNVRVTLKIKMAHSRRDALKLTVSATGKNSKTRCQFSPAIFERRALKSMKGVKSPEKFSAFYENRRRLGAVPLAGKGKDKVAIEMGFDMTDALANIKSLKDARFVLELGSHKGMKGQGQVEAASIMVFENGAAREWPFKIKKGGFGPKTLRLTLKGK